MLTARSRNLPFDEWVSKTLNDASIDTLPAWTAGLTERARICLLTATFNSREGVAQAIADGFDVATLQNAGKKVKREVEEWLSK